MKIDLTKSVFAKSEIEFIIDKLKQASAREFIRDKPEDNPSLIASYKGVEGKGISPKWNVKIYTHNKKKKGHSLVCVDKHVLGILLDEDYESFVPPDLQILLIDDAGWGFPLCGVMVGVSDEQTVQVAVVPVQYFRDDTEHNFQTKEYLQRYTELATQLLDQFGASPTTHRIEICTGFVNQPLRDQLRDLGYDVRVVEIEGLLQNELEELYKAYVIEEVGSDIYYDPKKMDKSEISRRYRECLEYGSKNCPHLIKTGWDAING